MQHPAKTTQQLPAKIIQCTGNFRESDIIVSHPIILCTVRVVGALCDLQIATMSKFKVVFKRIFYISFWTRSIKTNNGFPKSCVNLTLFVRWGFCEEKCPTGYQNHGDGLFLNPPYFPFSHYYLNKIGISRKKVSFIKTRKRIWNEKNCLNFPLVWAGH